MRPCYKRELSGGQPVDPGRGRPSAGQPGELKGTSIERKMFLST